ncbi:MAG: phosphoenolpyruvate--protein phosphotransferase [Lachnospiraceae bacterium]|nr:phosphoenolpyruvate--protein phosphotransferase [Lachnospiraceae bacterium]
MEIFQGDAGFGSIALGRIHVLTRNLEARSTNEIDTEKELAELEKAKNRVLKDLNEEYENALHEFGKKKAMVYETQMKLLQGHQLEDAIIGRILNQNCSVSKAVAGAGKHIEETLLKTDDEYLRNMSNDMKELTRRLLSSLDGYHGFDVFLKEPSIIATKSMTTLEFLQLDKTRILGLIVEDSSLNSHMAILAKSLNIPTIVGCEIQDEFDGKEAVLDGGWRVLYLQPDDQIKKDMNDRMEEERIKNLKLEQLKGKKCVSKSGKTIKLFGNICSSYEVSNANSCDVEGIGLYRSEVLYLESTEAPTEEQLFEEYKALVCGMNKKPVIIRTLDVGADKNLEYLHMQNESNSALGCRGIRFCIRNPEIFITQLKAILRAAVFGNVSIMYPMISSTKEILQANELLEVAKRQLILEGVLYKDVKQGVMIETPAAVMISDDIAKICSFISIGTNDLTQYTLGVDRENAMLSDICDYHHPAILKMIKMVVDNGHKHNIPVGICGELASDPTLSSYFLEIGVDDLSVAPQQILQLRNHILKLD